MKEREREAMEGECYSSYCAQRLDSHGFNILSKDNRSARVSAPSGITKLLETGQSINSQSIEIRDGFCCDGVLLV